MAIPGLTTEQLNLIKTFSPIGSEVKLFGSRVKGNFRANSDLDICIMSDLPRSSVTKVNELFEESNLPFTVDIVLYKDCTDDFKKIIDSSGMELF